MPTLEKIIIQDWRNIRLQELEFCPEVNCISGGNGQGKTNLADAIYYLSTVKSAFSPNDKYNFRQGCNSFALGGTYLPGDGAPSTHISIKVKDGADKQVSRDGKAYKRISEHIGLIPVVMVSPADSALVSDSADERRRFANLVISQMDSAYLDAVQRYTKLLSQRNAVLKGFQSSSPDATEGGTALLEAIDTRMEPLAQTIWQSRRVLADELRPRIEAIYEAISGGAEEVGIEYQSDLCRGTLREAFERHAARDRILGYTTAGIQRDDFIFTMKGNPIRRTGSQGQQKSFLVALKFAQFELMRQKSGSAPILLLDDLFDKLDISRTGELLKMVSGAGFGQIFLTDTDPSRCRRILESISAQSTYWEACSGEFKKL